MTNTEKVMLTALESASTALTILCANPAFADDAPEFNEGGVGYTASNLVNEAIRIAEAEGNKARDTFTLYAEGFGLKASDFGKLFMFRKRSYKITGCSPNSHTYPIHGTRLPDGKAFKFRAQDVVAKMIKVGG